MALLDHGPEGVAGLPSRQFPLKAPPGQAHARNRVFGAKNNCLAAKIKCLAESNRTRTESKATNKRLHPRAPP